MNSVHEPDSRTMSKNLTQEKYRVKSGQKQAECTECTDLGQPTARGALFFDLYFEPLAFPNSTMSLH